MNVRKKLEALRSITTEQQQYGTSVLRGLGIDYDDGTVEGVNDNIPRMVARIDDDITSLEYVWSSQKTAGELQNVADAAADAVEAETTARTAAISAEATARDTAISNAIADEVTARNAAISQATASMWKIKGRVNTTADLPASGNAVNDVYLVGATDATEFAEYYWTGTRWEYMGTVTEVDLSNYYTKAQTDAAISSAISDEVTARNSAISSAVSGKQDALTPGENITIAEDPETGELVIASTASGGAAIDDTTASTSTVYSSSKTDSKYAAAFTKTDSTSAQAIGTSANIPTERDIYYGLPKINNAHTYNSNSNFYAPTAGGTANYYLKGNGATAAPVWQAPATAAASGSNVLVTAGALYSAIQGVSGGIKATLIYNGSLSSNPTYGSNPYRAIIYSSLAAIKSYAMVLVIIDSSYGPQRWSLCPVDASATGVTVYLFNNYTSSITPDYMVLSYNGESYLYTSYNPQTYNFKAKIYGINF